MERRIVVTGLGTVNPLGNTVDSFWDSIKQAKSGITTIDSFDASSLSCRIAGVVNDLCVEDYIDFKEARKYDKFSIFAVVASTQARNRSWGIRYIYSNVS